MIKYLEKLPGREEGKRSEIGPVKITIRNWSPAIGMNEIKAFFHVICLPDNWGNMLVAKGEALSLLEQEKLEESHLILDRTYMLGSDTPIGITFPTRTSVVLEFFPRPGKEVPEEEAITFTILGVFPAIHWASIMGMIESLREPAAWDGKSYVFNRRYIFESDDEIKIDDPFYFTLYEDRSVLIDFNAIFDVVKRNIMKDVLQNLSKKEK